MHLERPGLTVDLVVGDLFETVPDLEEALQEYEVRL
jgi:hypothetical protein